MVKKSAERIYLGLIFLFLYLPIVVLIVLSFNNSKSKVQWGGFTLKWYQRMFQNSSIMEAFSTTILITLASAVLATLLGTLAALGIHAMKAKKQSIMLGATNIPLLNADIVTGLSMMLLFVRFTKLGMSTVLIAHITFNIPYVILNVLPRLKQCSQNTYEAALDLGATPLYAFYKIIWPQIRPGVFSGALMAMTMSLDDFSVTYFTKGAGINTLSTMIYTEMRKGIIPEMYALSTILFFLALVLLLIMNFGSSKETPAAKKTTLKKGFIVAAAGLMLVLIFICSRSTGSDNTVTVLNYGKYIDPRVLSMFEEETGIQVEYEEYVSPENMYTKYKAGSIDYDLICTSDYMVEKLIQEGEVNEINFDNIPNIKNLDQTYFEFSQSFDPENKYSIPYFFGTVGILYNKNMVDEADMASWACLWDEKYSGQIIMADSVRDSFMTALKYKGYSLNTTDENQLLAAQQMLIRQKPMVYSYLVDEAQDEMIAENAAMAVVYSGEAALAIDLNENLGFSVPKEGSNIWIDSWFMPKTSKHQENAEKFLDFLCREDIAALNFDYVYYATPNKVLYDSLDPELQQNTTIFPPKDVLENCEVLKSLDEAATATYNALWKELKSTD